MFEVWERKQKSCATRPAGYWQAGRKEKEVWLTLTLVAIDDVVVSARACGSAGPAGEA